MINDIFKPRSCSSCINAALNVYSNNFKKIFKATWLYILLLSVVEGLSAFISSPLAGNAGQQQSLLLPLLGLGAIFVVALLLSVRITSGVLTMLSSAPLKAMMKKVLKANLTGLGLYIIINIVVCGIMMGVAMTGAMQKLPTATQITVFALLGVVLLVVEALVLSPFIYFCEQLQQLWRGHRRPLGSALVFRLAQLPLDLTHGVHHTVSRDMDSTVVCLWLWQHRGRRTEGGKKNRLTLYKK